MLAELPLGASEVDMPCDEPIQRWSTNDVPASQRVDHYARALSTAVDPMRLDSARREAFRADITSAALGPLQVIRSSGTEHRCSRQDADIAGSAERSLHLRISSSGWAMQQRGNLYARAGDGILFDSHFGFELDSGDFEVTHIKMPFDWLHQWVRSPAALAGRVLTHDSRWGTAFIAFARQLTPEFVSNAPLPPRVLADQLAVLLALMESETLWNPQEPGRATSSLRDRVRECIVQRCTEPMLVASQVAGAVGISTRTLHRTLAAHAEAFEPTLLRARLDVAVRMLESPLFDRLTTAEIGRRAGFRDSSHFARVVHRGTGQTPMQIRRRRRATLKESSMVA
jgi:AraC-like DNA-binding protein